MKHLSLILTVLMLLLISGCNNGHPDKSKPKAKSSKQNIEKQGNCKVTFVELGSVNCVPCKMMQPILEEIEKEYKGVKVIFHDVWTPEGKKKAKPYKIKLIPTQVFLDKNGKEYFRHEGFFPKEDLKKILEKGLKL